MNPYEVIVQQSSVVVNFLGYSIHAKQYASSTNAQKYGEKVKKEIELAVAEKMLWKCPKQKLKNYLVLPADKNDRSSHKYVPGYDESTAILFAQYLYPNIQFNTDTKSVWACN